MSTLLTQQEREEKKRLARESEIRQNIKSHCTRIRDGIRKNGSTMGRKTMRLLRGWRVSG